MPVPLRRSGSGDHAPAVRLMHDRRTWSTRAARTPSARPLTLGSAVPDGRAPQSPRGQYFQAHCTRHAGGTVWLGTAQPLFTGERRASAAASGCARVIGCGSAAAECELVRVVDDDASA
jgi:hypothetical protein